MYKLILVTNKGDYQTYSYSSRLAAQTAYEAVIAMPQVKTAWIE